MEYDPDKPVDKKLWLALPETDQIDLVLEYHLKHRIELPNELLHAAIHSTVESQVALGDDLIVEKKVQELIEEGLNRHDAIHAVGSVLAEYMYDLSTQASSSQDPKTEYQNELKNLTAKSWYERYGE
jgi:hypothetical protein